jgi:hypothetical protein
LYAEGAILRGDGADDGLAVFQKQVERLGGGDGFDGGPVNADFAGIFGLKSSFFSSERTTVPVRRSPFFNVTWSAAAAAPPGKPGRAAKSGMRSKRILFMTGYFTLMSNWLAYQ